MDQSTKTPQPPKKKNKKTALIIINIVALLAIAGAASYLFYFKDKLAEDQAGRGPGGMGPGGGMDFATMDADTICEMVNNQSARPSSEETDRSRPANAPAEMPKNFDPEEHGGQFSEMQTLLQTICADNEVSDEEKAELEELQETMSANRPSTGQFAPTKQQ